MQCTSWSLSTRFHYEANIKCLINKKEEEEEEEKEEGEEGGGGGGEGEVKQLRK